MEPIAHLIKVTAPNYLSGLPIPDSIGGWFRLGGKLLFYKYFVKLPLKLVIVTLICRQKKNIIGYHMINIF